MERAHGKCVDCLIMKAKVYSGSDFSESPDRKSPEKRRSFLQTPKSYVSRLPAPLTTYSSPPPVTKPVEVETPRTQPIPIPQSTPSQTTVPETQAVEQQEFFIGDRVVISGVKTGTLLYFGATHIAPGSWCGIALDEPEGIHDGLVNDVRYFTCRKGHGIFAPVERVAHLDHKAIQTIIKSPPKVSQIPSKSKLSHVPPIRDEIGYQERSHELLEECYIDLDDEILGLDENGIIRDDDDFENISAIEKPKPKRKLPKLPKPASYGYSRIQYMRREFNRTMDENIMDENSEILQAISSSEDDTDGADSNIDEKADVHDLHHSAGGSSGGEDTWSLNKDYIAMCDGKAQYLNITFDGESESKTSTQEPSEESPSPEFIFDQEMIEDGEFAGEPLDISRDSSMGLISSYILDKNDMLSDLFGNEDDVDNGTSQGTLEPMSEDKDITPEKADEMHLSVDFEDADVAASTPAVENKTHKREHVNLNETYDAETSHCLEKQILNSTFDIETKKLNLTYTQEDVHVKKEVLNSTFTQDDLQTVEKVLNSTFTQKESQVKSSHIETAIKQQNLNGTFIMDNKAETPGAEQSAMINIKDEIPKTGPMTDSGISLRGSMSESSMSSNLPNSMIESGVSLKGSMIDPSIRRSMLDSGIVVQSVTIDSNMGLLKSESGIKVSDFEHDKSEIQTKGVSFIKGSVQFKEGVSEDLVHQDLDDSKLMKDLTDGHQRKERPISFLSTTSADTGYVPDTDSEVGTLTLNSPQEWMDRALPQTTDKARTNLTQEFTDVSKLGPVLVESDSDFGTMTGDTDNEADRIELPRTNSVIMNNIQETEESEDEVTQVEDAKTLNTTVTQDDKLNETFTAESSPDDSTSDLVTENHDGTSTESVPMVTITIEDDDKTNEDDKGDKKKNGKQKTPKKKKFNVVKDFKKPNTTNVVSKLSEYLKAPLPVKPKEDKNNTEEAKNRQNSLKGKIDLSKVTSKIANKSIIDDNKKQNGEVEKKEPEVIVEKEPPKKIKRTPPKSKWDAIMSKIDNSKDQEKIKPKAEVKSKLEAFLHIPPPAPPKKEEPPKPKRRISSIIPDYSKVQSKLKYTAPPPAPKPKKDESPSRPKTASPSRSKTDSPSRSVSDTSQRKRGPSDSQSPTESPNRKRQDSSPAGNKDKENRSRRLSTGVIKNDRVRNLSGDSVKRPEIKDKVLHIDLADSLDGRGSTTDFGSAISSRPSSRTDLSTTEDEVTTIKQHPQIERTLSLQDRRDSSSVTSVISEAGSEVMSGDTDQKLQKSALNQQRRKSGLIMPSNSLDSSSSGEGGLLRGRPKIVKPVIRQQSAPSPLTITTPYKHPLFTNQASKEKTVSRRSRNQNRNKTKSKKESKEKNKPPETVLAEVHTKEVQRLEALCEARTKQLNMVRLQLQNSNVAFDGMSAVVNYLAHDLDGFACPGLKHEIEKLTEALNNEKTKIATLEEQKASLEGIITQLKEQHKEYVNSLETENEQSLKYQRESLTTEHQHAITEMKEKRASDIAEIRKAHEEYITKLLHEHAVAVEKLRTQHSEGIRDLQRKQENQMEELHKQHQDKLEDITGRFDSIKLTLSDKVESLRNECDRLRDRARHCEEALQRDSDFKVQCALAPYKDLPQEIESLKTVVEMRNEEINKLRSQNVELQKRLEELPIAQEKIIALQQKKENLEAIISMKTDHEKVLHERCQNLMKKYDKESRANKRLSMEYEELMYKLSESFSESDIGSQEALFYQKLGMSPNSSGEFLGSPGGGRKLRLPSGSGSSESSPSRSPGGPKRSLSSSVEDKEERKLKRRSGNYLLDEKKLRSTSPLAQQNPLTKSWSPSTQSDSPTRVKKGRDGNKMSQSWCVDMDASDDQNDTASKIPRSKSGSEKSVKRKATEKNPSDSKQAFVSLEDSNSSHGLIESELSASLKSNGISEDEEVLTTYSSPRSGRETVTLSESNDVFINDNSMEPMEEHIPANTSEQATIQVLPDINNKSNTAGKSTSLATEIVSCPVSKLPVKIDENVQKDLKSALKSHTETTV